MKRQTAARVESAWVWLFCYQDVPGGHERPPRIDMAACGALIMLVNAVILGLVTGAWWFCLGSGLVASGVVFYSWRARACFDDGMQAGRDGLTEEIILAMMDQHMTPEEYLLREVMFADEVAEAARQVRRSRRS